MPREKTKLTRTDFIEQLSMLVQNADDAAMAAYVACQATMQFTWDHEIEEDGYPTYPSTLSEAIHNASKSASEALHANSRLRDLMSFFEGDVAARMMPKPPQTKLRVHKN